MAWYENLGGYPPRWKMYHPIDPGYHGNIGIWTGDFDGDGITDFAHSEEEGSSCYIILSPDYTRIDLKTDVNSLHSMKLCVRWHLLDY